MLEGVLGAFSRLRIFLSYASEHKRIAEELALTLKNSGHQVFFDKDSLGAGDDYIERIRDDIRRCDRFIVLVSRSSLQEGRYTLSELKLAKERWPAPKGKVFPVLLDKTIRPDELPPYLSAVHALSIQGNATADIAAEIDKTRKVRPRVWASLALLLIAAVAGIYAWSVNGPGHTHVTFKPPFRVNLRPAISPPERGGQGDAWLKSALTVSGLSFGYESLARSRTTQIEPEDVVLKIDDQSYGFEYRYEVNFIDNCEGGWHCVKGTTPLRSLEGGEVLSVQNLFRVFPTDKLSWEDFADRVANAQKVSITFAPRIKAEGKPIETQVRHECVLDVGKFKTAIAETRQARGRIPIFMQQTCTYP